MRFSIDWIGDGPNASAEERATLCDLYLAEFQDETLRDLPCTRLEVDEAWAFVYAKNKNVERAKAAPEDAGDGWTWTAICADTKLIPTWRVGDRTSGTAISLYARS